MQGKRFKLVKENDQVRPLHPRSTNVKTPAAQTRVKQPLKRSNGGGSDVKKRRKKDSGDSETVFENDHVQLIFGETSPRAVSPAQRLDKIVEEEGNSLQLDDFDQPPESTSTPVNGGKDSRGSLLIYDGLPEDSPLHNRYMEYQQLRVQAQQQQQQMFSYMPMGFVPQYQYPSAFPVGYNNGIASSAQTIGPSIGGQPPMPMGMMGAPMGFPMGVPFPQPTLMDPYARNYVYGPTSQSSSYKSSGGDATYQGSDSGRK